MNEAGTIREKHDGALAARSSVRLWLRLLSCTTVVEKRIKRRLAARFDATLPRFDVLAALDRNREGMMMGELSQSLLVSNGNVTGVVRTLLREGHVSMTQSPTDGRSSIVRLTPSGRDYFARLAEAHNSWIEEMLGHLGQAERDTLYELLGKLKISIAADRSEARP